MKVSAISSTGNSSKFLVKTKRSEFIVAISYTLRTKIWKLDSQELELTVASDLAEAIVSRHDPALPFKSIYIFAEHNSDASFELEIQRIRKYGKLA